MFLALQSMYSMWSVLMNKKVYTQTLIGAYICSYNIRWKNNLQENGKKKKGI